MLTPEISTSHIQAVRFDRNPGEVLDWHKHNNLSFCFVIRGDYAETTQRQSLTCRAGDVVIKTADMQHLNTFGQHGALCLLLEISSEFIKERPDFPYPQTVGLLRSQELAHIGLELLEELRLPDTLSRLMLESIAIRSLVSVIRMSQRNANSHAEVEVMRGLLDAGEKIEELTRKYLTASETKTARRLFYEIEGCSPNKYVLKRRALRALNEVLSTDRSLAEIAVCAGFYDQAHFTKVFSESFGVTPGRLRSRIQHRDSGGSPMLRKTAMTRSRLEY